MLLVERYGFLGGMATAGLVNPFMPYTLQGRRLTSAVFDELLERLQVAGALHEVPVNSQPSMPSQLVSWKSGSGRSSSREQVGTHQVSTQVSSAPHPSQSHPPKMSHRPSHRGEVITNPFSLKFRQTADQVFLCLSAASRSRAFTEPSSGTVLTALFGVPDLTLEAEPRHLVAF